MDVKLGEKIGKQLLYLYGRSEQITVGNSHSYSDRYQISRVFIIHTIDSRKENWRNNPQRMNFTRETM